MDGDSRDVDTTSFSERFAEKSNYSTIGLLFYTPLLSSYNLCQIVWFIVLMDAFLDALSKILQNNHIKETYWIASTFTVLYFNCYVAYDCYISSMHLPF